MGFCLGNWGFLVMFNWDKQMAEIFGNSLGYWLH